MVFSLYEMNNDEELWNLTVIPLSWDIKIHLVSMVMDGSTRQLTMKINVW